MKHFCKGLILGIGILIGIGFAIGCGRSHEIVKDAEVSPELKEAKEVFTWDGMRLLRLCDEGHLIYLSMGSHGKTIWVIEGGCR